MGWASLLANVIVDHDASVKTGLRNDPSGAGEAAWTATSVKTGVLHDPSGAGEAAWASVSVKTGTKI